MIKRRAKTRDIAAFVDYATGFQSEVCLRWPFGKNSAGYGHFKRDGRWVLAHRVVCETVHGTSPNGFPEAAHSCGNGHEGCVNPRHLSWKSRKENARDMVEHGTSVRGRRHYLAKLDEEKVRFIRATAKDVPVRAIARKLDVSPGVVYQVLRGKSWAWVQ